MKRGPLGSAVEHSLHTRGVSSSNLLAGTRFNRAGDASRPLLVSACWIHPLSDLVTKHFEEQPAELLFAYGTLQQEAVQLATFGRRLEGVEDALPGYRLRIT